MRSALAPAKDTSCLLDMMADLNAMEGIPFSRPKFRRVLVQLLGDPSLGLVPLFLVKREIVG